MDRIVVPTKFNSTGRRVFKVPVSDEKVCAPAYQIYRKACRAAEQECRTKKATVRNSYIESLAQWIAAYVAADTTPAEHKYRITKFLAKLSLHERGPMNVKGPGSSMRWSVQISGILGLAEVEEQHWETYVENSRNADAERDTALERAKLDCVKMKRGLRLEIRECIRRQVRGDSS
jgi:hypothetical protein